MDIKIVQSIREELNKFSFTKVCIKEDPHTQWDEKTKYYPNKDCCRACEKNIEDISSTEKDDMYKHLCYVSHGAHALDFCKSMDIGPDEINETWNDFPVLFLFENPSVQYGDLYDEKMTKCPAQRWYWINSERYKKEDCVYPKYYKQKCYGSLIASLIKTFKLANAYMTNTVKCGMVYKKGEEKAKFLTTADYNSTYIDKCVNHVLMNEIDLLLEKKKYENGLLTETTGGSKNLIVFAFGERTYKLAYKYLKEKYNLDDKQICQLPHPAFYQMADDFRKYVLFWKVYKTLRLNNIACTDALKEFYDYELPQVEQ